jgi:hypothetical protein
MVCHIVEELLCSPDYICLRIGGLLACGKHLHDRIISLREDVWDHKISLTLPLFIEVPVPIQTIGSVLPCWQQPSIMEILIGNKSSGISYQLRDVYSICRCSWNIATYNNGMFIMVKVKSYLLCSAIKDDVLSIKNKKIGTYFDYI